MTSRMSPVLFLIMLFLLMPLSLNASEIYVDSFESGNLLKTGSSGFRWADSAWVTVVSETHEKWLEGRVVNLEKSNASSFPGENWSPKTGEHSLRFRYAAGQDMSEQRFDLGTAESDLWVSYWLKVPENFSHSSSSPSNHKLFALWMDGYSSKGLGPTIAWEFWNNGNNGSNLGFHYSEGGYRTMGSHLQLTPFISYPTDQGRWMHVVFHMKAATAINANDGVIEMFRKWDGDDSYTKFHEKTDCNTFAPAGGPAGWKGGYIMGWANASYSNDTEWLVDDYKLTNVAPFINATRGESRPNAPAGLSAEY